MTQLLQQFSDDQLALGLCLGALLVSAAFMYVSYFVGQATTRKARPWETALPLETAEFPATIPVSASPAAPQPRERAA